MDHSIYSCKGKASASKNQSCEESGWTAYFEDFSKGGGIEPSYCSSLGGSSLISDAASYAAWKFSHHHHNQLSDNKGAQINPLKKLCFKKARTKQISEDDPLEDTASSPVNSPKVRDLSPTEFISRKIDDQLEGSMGNRFTSSENYSDLQIEDKHIDEAFNRNNMDCTDLKKRGLCLVPLSLINYLG
ncbi:vascular-related unknown protein 1 [Lotus japonicus]|uniref:Uncharacterized protein n=1 Tax=Lotus japonicus TaxID=34305 RepID=I3SC35_LOTJA|nr:vascular-related unknown protein 1 [Lotus japonicus]AFK37827.1 unknown [Lotus japonicus]